MTKRNRYLAILVLLLGVAGIVIGLVFITQSVQKSNWMTQAMRSENVTLGLTEAQIKNGEVVDTAREAQAAADTIREHRHNIAPSYNALLAGGQYDPTNPKHLTYSQAINMENYLYLAVLGFGVTTEIIGTGVFMIISGLALCATGAVLLGVVRKTSN